MSNGLFSVDGIDVAALVHEHLSPRLLPCVLTKPGTLGERDPDHPTRAPERGPGTDHACRGFIEDFSTGSVDGTFIKAGDRKVTLIANSIEGGVEPEGGIDRDLVTVEGKLWRVHRIVKRDPAGASFVLQVRDPAEKQEA